MLDKIEGLVKNYAGDAVKGMKDIPAGKGDAVTSAATDSIMGFFKNKVGGGGDLSAITDMFKDKSAIDNVTSQISGGFIQSLSKIGIGGDTAKMLSTALIPLILSKFTGGKGGLSDILGQLTGGAGDLTSSIGGMFGGKKGKDSGTGGLLGKLKDMI